MGSYRDNKHVYKIVATVVHYISFDSVEPPDYRALRGEVYNRTTLGIGTLRDVKVEDEKHGEGVTF